jgi:arsenate reductase
LSAAHLQKLLSMLGLSPRQLLRTGEDEYKTLGLSNSQLTDAQLIDAMANQPKLIERPILVVGDKAVIGRPPERILEIMQ